LSPPNLSPSVIRNLGSTFCNLGEQELTDENLNKKHMVSTPGGKKTLRKKLPSKEFPGKLGLCP